MFLRSLTLTTEYPKSDILEILQSISSTNKISDVSHLLVSFNTWTTSALRSCEDAIINSISFS